MIIARRAKTIIKKVPFLRAVGTLARNVIFPATKFDSRNYWEARYAQGGTSGAGSYGQLADFKAKVINDFLSNRNVKSVIEFGCGDGNQLSLAEYPVYIGLDVAKSAIERCKTRFADDDTMSFFLYDPICFVDKRGVFRAELALSLDVIYHLVEDQIFELYMQHLFASATKFVVIYSSDVEQPTDNAQHVRHRRFSSWVEENIPGWKLIGKLPNEYPLEHDSGGSPSDFFFYERRTSYDADSKSN